jgi:hypothetical protein
MFRGICTASAGLRRSLVMSGSSEAICGSWRRWLGCMLHFPVAVTEVVVRSRQLSPVLRQPGPVGQRSDRLCISATRLGSGSWPAAPQLLDEQAV